MKRSEMAMEILQSKLTKLALVKPLFCYVTVMLLCNEMVMQGSEMAMEILQRKLTKRASIKSSNEMVMIM